MNLIGRTPKWLSGALSLQEPSLPAQLDTTTVLPVIEIGQGGWGAAFDDWRISIQTRAQNVAGAAETLWAESDVEGALILGLAAYRTGGAAASNFVIRYYDPVKALALDLASVSVAIGGTARWADFNLGECRLFVPPRNRLELVWPTTTAGESWTVHYMRGKIRTGFNPF